MDWLKVSIERLFSFLATLVPGSAFLLLFVLHKQMALQKLWTTEVLSYETKLAIVVLLTFASGFAVQDGVTRLAGAIGGFIGGVLRPTNEDQQRLFLNNVQPWRNSVWRALLKGYLGQAAPEDIPYVWDELLQKRLELISIKQLDEKERDLEAATALRKKADADLVDHQWATWWKQFHLPALLGQHRPIAMMSETLTGNFQTASLILLCACDALDSRA